MAIAFWRIFKRLRNLEQRLATLNEEAISDQIEEKPQITLVIAGTYQQYEYWRRSSGLTKREARYISGPELLLGYSSDQKVVFTGTWQDRRDALELWESAKRYRVREEVTTL